MLSRFERLNGKWSVAGYWRVDVHRIDIRVLQQLLVRRVSLRQLDAKLIANLIKRIVAPLANGRDASTWVFLINGNELGSKAESDEGYVDLVRHK